jgi:hypothetical protein
MSQYKLYKHLISTNIFNVKTKIDAYRKPPKHANKNR